MKEALLRTLTPTVTVTGILVRRGADFAAAEDAVQDALVEAVRVWADKQPADPQAWLVTVAWRKFLDAARANTSRRHSEARVETEPQPEPGDAAHDALQLYFLYAYPSLTPASAVALTLRAVGGLTTRQIALGYLVPEATMAQRISRAKRTISGVAFDQPGDVATVLRVLYLVFNEGYSGDIDLAGEAIRLTRQVAARTNHPHRPRRSRPQPTPPHRRRRLPPRTQPRPHHRSTSLYPSRPISTNLPERDHLTRQAARLDTQLRS
jgi:RNA polymerase sigma factor (sigma-70 family)